MSLGVLNHKHIFGLKGDVKDNVGVIDDNLIAYPAGNNIILYNTESRSQSFIQGSDGCIGITAMAISPCKRFLAIAEQGEKGVISVYDIKSLKRRKTFSTNESGPTYVSLAFNSDSTLLLSQGGPPDWTLISWSWETATSNGAFKTSDSPNIKIIQCSYSPLDSSILCVTGEGIFKCFKLTEKAFKSIPTSLGNRNKQTIICHTWLPEAQGMILLSSDSGELLLYRDGKLDCVIPSVKDADPVTTLITSAKGFFSGSISGVIAYYEYTEPNEDNTIPYVLTRTFENENITTRICHMSLSLKEEFLVCTTSSNQIYKIDLTEEIPATQPFKPLSYEFHGVGPSGMNGIQGMDVCLRKPLIVTTGDDCTIRIWNYMERSLELVKHCNDFLYGCAFHPSGLNIIVGENDKLHLYNVLLDDLISYKTYPIRQCTAIRFSNGGQYFACGNGAIIQIYNTYIGDCIHTLRIHNSKITSLFWSNDDTQVLSAGLDGGLYQWNMKDGKREVDYVNKSVPLTSITATNDFSGIFIVGNDKKLREIEFPGAIESKVVESSIILGQVELAHSQKLLFAAGGEKGKPGCIRLYKFPLTGDMREYQALAGTASAIRVTYDDLYLFVAGSDGVLCIYEIKEKDGTNLFPERVGMTPIADEILVTSKELKEHENTMTELRNKVDELSLHNDYQLRLKVMNNEEKEKELSEEYKQKLDEEKQKYDNLYDQKREMELEYEEDLKHMEEEHRHKIQESEADYQQKIMREVERYQQMVSERDTQQARFEEQQKRMINNHENYVMTLTNDYERQLDEQRALKMRLQDEISELERECFETERQLEEDIDTEIENIRKELEIELNDEKESTMSFKGENGLMKKKFTALQKDVENQNEEIKGLIEKEKQLKAQIDNLQNEIQNLKQTIRTRDDTIGNKEKKIYELKKKNQELEKFKFVLDYKIKELKKQIEPKEEEIANMKTTIKKMDHDLEKYHKSNAKLDNMIGDIRGKLDNLQRDIIDKRSDVHDHENVIKTIQSDLIEASQLIQYPEKLKECIIGIYKKYYRGPIAIEGIDSHIENEYSRQRQYLEQSLGTLSTRLTTNTHKHESENIRLMQKNMVLIKEVTELRTAIEDIKRTRKRRDLLGIQVEEVTDDILPISQETYDRLNEQKQLIATLKYKLQELENLHLQKSASRERLPPIDGEYQ